MIVDFTGGYRLVDLEAQRFPREILDASDLDLKPGNLAKLIFHGEDEWADKFERMWTIVREAHPDCYIGELSNHPRLLTSVRAGSRIRFERRHVFQVQR